VKTRNLVSSDRGATASERDASLHQSGCGKPHAADGDGGPIVVIDRCEPARSYLVRCLQEATSGGQVVAFASLRQWLQVARGYPRAKVILICDSSHDGPDGCFTEPLPLPTRIPVIAVPNTGVPTVLTGWPCRSSQIAARDGIAFARRSTTQEAGEQEKERVLIALTS
jgi:hypothetical protein